MNKPILGNLVRGSWRSPRGDSAKQDEMLSRPAMVTAISARSDTRHVPSLDGLRGLAVILVMLYHSEAFSFTGKGWLVHAAGMFFESGWLGVNIFFALSGFLITGILLDTVKQPHYLRTFYRRRSLRILPLYYAVLAFAIVASLALRLSWHGSLPYYLCFLENYGDPQSFTVTGSAATLRLGHFWSLAVEEQFYLLWPFVVLLLPSRRCLSGITLAILLLCPLARWFALAHGVPSGHVALWTPFILDLLAWGALAAIARRHLSPHLCQRFARYAVLAGSAMLLALLIQTHGHLEHNDPRVIEIGYSALGIATSGLILLLLYPAPLTSAFANPFLRWLGRLSYGIYVFHYLLSAEFGFVRAWVVQVTHSKALGALSLFALTFFVGTTLAWFSYNFYEERWLRLKNKLAPYPSAPSI